MAVGQGFVGEGVDAVKPLKLLHCKTAGCVPHSRLGRWLAEQEEKQAEEMFPASCVHILCAMKR